MASNNNIAKVELAKLGKKASLKRQSLGISQEEFSSKAGLHRTYVSQFERGLRNPTFSTLSKIAKALGVSISELID